MNMKKTATESLPSLPMLPCACSNLRRMSRMVTKLYNRELSETGLELTQFTLLMALSRTGETTQGRLGSLLALDSTSLTRMLRLLIERGWIGARPGEDRRAKLLKLTRAGREKLERSLPPWERAQRRLRAVLGDSLWAQMTGVVAGVTRACEAA
jgi:DNA-binding MarR family transcriptional regulator